jgi:hypothetical protein
MIMQKVPLTKKNEVLLFECEAVVKIKKYHYRGIFFSIN